MSARLANSIDGVSLAVFSGFSDEMQKIGGKAGEIAKTVGHYLAGGAKQDLTHVKPQGPLAKALHLKPEKITIPNAGPRIGSGISALTNPATRVEALKVLGTRGATGVGVLGVGAGASKVHHEHEQKELSDAYMAGAKDMYAQGQGK